jgi:hypothetical protein
MAVTPRLLALLVLGLAGALALGHRRLEAQPFVGPPPAWWSATQRPPTAEESLYGRIASAVARRPVGVRCASIGSSGVEGQVWFPDARRPADFADLEPAVCNELYQFRTGRRAWAVVCLLQRGNACGADAYWTVFALTALAHEAVHLRGVRDESLTQCLAIGEIHVVAQALGADPEQAEALQRFAIQHEYAIMPSEYRTRDCSRIGPGVTRPGL